MSFSPEANNPEVKGILRGLAALIVKYIPRGYGFTLLIFTFGKEGELYYISDAMREDMIATMKEFIAKNEGRHIDATQTKQ